MAFIDTLKSLLDSNSILDTPAEMCGFTEDWRGRYRGAATCVVLPSNTKAVAEIVSCCARYGVPVLPQGGNTSLSGGSVPIGSGTPPVIVNLQRMRQIRAVDAVNNTITVDAGCVLAVVQEAARQAGRLYPISLGAEGSCQIGGIVSTNAGGTGVLRYGTTRENVLGLEVVLPDGQVWDGLHALRKNNSGYDLKQLFIGAEGTLGLITGAVLKLHPLPSARSVAWLAVVDVAAGITVLGIFQEQLDSQLSAFELMNGPQIAMVIEHSPEQQCPVDAPAACHVLVELTASADPVVLEGAMQGALEQAMEAGLLIDAVIATSEAQCAALWELRHSAPEANRKGGIGLTSDCAVPISALPIFIENATRAVRSIVPELPVLFLAHLGDGNVHFVPFFSFSLWKGLADRAAAAEQVRGAVNAAAMALGGTFSAEHGIGRTLTSEMARHKPPVELAMMRAVKRLFDPANLFNPGKVLPPAEPNQG
jgi:FAD/FMN-containing dehydrogenase